MLPRITLFVFFIVSVRVFKVGMTGSVLNLMPFQESPKAIRLVPDTNELNEFMDRTLDSIRRLPEVKNGKPLPLRGLYLPFARWVCNQSVSGIFQMSRGLLWNLTSLFRVGDVYIDVNEEESIQVVSKLSLGPLRLKNEHYDIIFGNVYENGSIDAVVDIEHVDVRLTIRVKQNISYPLVFVCDGEVDRMDLTLGEFDFTVTGLQGNQEFYRSVFDWLSSHFDFDSRPHLEKFLSLFFEIVIRRDDQICSSLVMCTSCSFYAAEF